MDLKINECNGYFSPTEGGPLPKQRDEENHQSGKCYGDQTFRPKSRSCHRSEQTGSTPLITATTPEKNATNTRRVMPEFSSATRTAR